MGFIRNFLVSMCICVTHTRDIISLVSPEIQETVHVELLKFVPL